MQEGGTKITLFSVHSKLNLFFLQLFSLFLCAFAPLYLSWWLIFHAQLCICWIQFFLGKEMHLNKMNVCSFMISSWKIQNTVLHIIKTHSFFVLFRASLRYGWLYMSVLCSKYVLHWFWISCYLAFWECI